MSNGLFSKLFGWTSIVDDMSLRDVKSDRKEAKRVETYYISEKAIYFRGRYLPLAKIKSVCVYPSVYRPHFCAGKGLPAYKLKVDYAEEKPLVLIFDGERNAHRAAAMIANRNPYVAIKEWRDPLTGARRKNIPLGFL